MAPRKKNPVDLALETRVDSKGETGVTNAAAFAPYRVEMELTGTADMLMHRYDVEEVESKSGGTSKGGKSKKTDNVESYLYRGKDGLLRLPGEVVKACIVDGAKFLQDPRSPRKAAKDLFKAGILAAAPTEFLNYEGKQVKEWDYLDKRRAVVQRNAILRVRPAFLAGWRVKATFDVIASDLITEDFFRKAVDNAGRFCGMCDFRPDFGRFRVDSWRMIPLTV